jgi:hypothetical protein
MVKVVELKAEAAFFDVFTDAGFSCSSRNVIKLTKKQAVFHMLKKAK